MADPLTDTLNRRAAFAQNFTNTGNLDQRRRFAQDLSDAADRQTEREAAEFEALQQRDPQLMNAVTGRMREGRLTREGQVKAGLESRKFERQLGRDVTMDELNERKFLLQEKNGAVQRRKAIMDIDRAERELDDTFAYEVGEMQLRDEFGPGTEEYRQGVAELAASLPYLKKDIRQETLKEVGFEDPDAVYKEVSQRLQTAKKEGIEFRETVKTKGGTMTLADRPDSTSKGNVDLSRLDRLKEKRAPLLNIKPEKMTEEQKDLLGYYENEIKAIDAQRQPAGQPGVQPAAQLPATASGVKPVSTPSGTTMWRTDAQGNKWEYTADKKPTGNYIPAK